MDFFEKQPREVLDYDVDAREWFKSIPDDDIQSVNITVTSESENPPALELGPTVHPEHVLIGAEPKEFKIWLGGGTDGEQYLVTCVISTEQDRQFEHEFLVIVRDER